jgi:predicted N-acetyltransferase YhbS
MAKFSDPRPARLDEFAEAMAFTDRVFRPGQRGRRIVQSQYPHAYRQTSSFARRLLLLRDVEADGQLVGCMGIHPMELRLGAATVSAAGIGIVGADPRRRGEGIMSLLLVAALRRMQTAGHAISILGGDRQRYGWFGWENGGVRRRYLLTRRMLGAPSRTERQLRLTRFDPDKASIRRKIHRLSSEKSYGVAHSAADVAPLLDRVGRETWIVEDSDRFACICLGGPNRHNRPYERVDAVFGDRELIVSGLRCMMARFRREQLWALGGPDPEDAAIFEPVSASWITEDDGMIRILDLPRLVKQLAPEIARLRRLTGTRAPDLQIRLSDLGQTATLSGGSGKSRICKMTSLQAVQLLFGARSLLTTGLVDLLPKTVIGPWSAILPLPLHVPAIHHI